jgi:hypothetical protein
MKKQTTNQLPKTSKEMLPMLERVLEASRMLEKRLYRLEERSTSDALLKRMMDELARTLLLSGSGQHFERSIDSAISRYRLVREEVEWIRHNSGIADEVRSDVSVCVARVLRVFHDDLLRLGVEIHEVAPGTLVDRDRHYVVEQLETECKKQLNTVGRCVLPGFSWEMKSGSGKRELAANVHAFTKLLPLFDTQSADASAEQIDFVPLPVAAKPR